MKALNLSICLFCILLLCIICNSVFISKTSDYIYGMADGLTDTADRGERIAELECFWNENRDLVSITLPRNRVDEITEIILCLRNAHEYNREDEFEKYRSLLTEKAKNIGRYEFILLITIK